MSTRTTANHHSTGTMKYVRWRLRLYAAFTLVPLTARG